MKVDISLIKKMREKTGLPVMECKRALEEGNYNLEKAFEILKKRGVEIALKKGERETSQGLIFSYIHTDGKLGVLLEVNCETDFVARTEDFKELVKNIALQIAAMAPMWVEQKEIPSEIIEEKRKLWDEKQLNDFYKKKVLLEQSFIKDEKLTVRDYLRSAIAKLGENIVIKRFVRYELGK